MRVGVRVGVRVKRTLHEDPRGKGGMRQGTPREKRGDRSVMSPVSVW